MLCCEKKCICGAVMDYVENVYICDNPDCEIIYTVDKGGRK